MPKIILPPYLLRFKSLPRECEVPGDSVFELIENLENQYPGVRDYVVYENGKMRQHVNIFIGDRLLSDREWLTDKVSAEDTVSIMQALSGG